MSTNLNDVLKHLNTQTFTFSCKLLSDSNKVVEFRPMQVKDQKILVVNSDSDAQVTQLKGLLQLVESCVKKSPVEPIDMFISDFMWLLLNIRIRSIGAEVVLIGRCKKCEKKTSDIVLNLEKDVTTTTLEGGIKDNIIKISKELSICLTLPTVKNILNKKTDDIALEVLSDEIDHLIFNGEQIYLTDEEKIKFLDDLDSGVIKKFENFTKKNYFGVTITHDFTCESCRETNTILVQDNMMDFF